MCDEYRNLVLSGDYGIASVEIFVWTLTSIESCVVCDLYRNLVLSVASIEIFVLTVANIESCVV